MQVLKVALFRYFITLLKIKNPVEHTRSDWQSAHYGGSYRCCLPVRILLAATTQVDQTVVDAGCSKDAGPCLHQQSTRLRGVTNSLLVLLVGCWISCSHSRTLLLVWSLEPEKLTASHLWCWNFTGYQSGKGSGSRQPFWSSSAFMDWLRHICLSTAS